MCNRGKIGKGVRQPSASRAGQQRDTDFVIPQRRYVELFAIPPVHLYQVAPGRTAKLLTARIARAVAVAFAKAVGCGKRRAQPIGDHEELCMNRRARGGKGAAGQRLHARSPVQRDAHLRGSGCHVFLQVRAAHRQSPAAAECGGCAGVGIVKRDACKARAIPLVKRHPKPSQQPHRLRHQTLATGLVDGRTSRVIECDPASALPQSQRCRQTCGTSTEHRDIHSVHSSSVTLTLTMSRQQCWIAPME